MAYGTEFAKSALQATQLGQQQQSIDLKRQEMMNAKKTQLQDGVNKSIVDSVKVLNDSLAQMKASPKNFKPQQINEALMPILNQIKKTISMSQQAGYTVPIDSQLLENSYRVSLYSAPNLKEQIQTKATEAGAIKGAEQTAIEEAKGDEYKRFGAYSPSLKKQFTAFDDGAGNIMMLDESGNLTRAPVDTYPVSTQATGTATELGLTKSQTGQQVIAEEEAVGRLGAISNALKDIEETPGAGGIRGLAVDKIGGLLGQLPIIGESAERGFAEAIAGATPEEVNRVRTNSRVLVAQMLSDITGEESGRFTEQERALATETLKSLDPNASFPQIRSAYKTLMEISVQSERRSQRLQGVKPRHDLETPNGRDAFAQEMVELGLSEDEAIDLTIRMTKQERLLRKK